MNEFMKIALEEAEQGFTSGDGGPFGAVLVKGGEIIAKGHNLVLKANDPTAHAEMIVIRLAAKKIGTWNLSGCELYSSCEPCPMCFGAICWARIKKVYYGCTEKDAAEIGFEDKEIYDALKGESQNLVAMESIDRGECIKLFKDWMQKKDKVTY